MRYFDLRAGSLLLVSVLFIGAIMFQHQTVLASIAQSKDQKQLYLSQKKLVQATAEEMQLMQQYYPIFQGLIDSKKVVIRQTTGSDQESGTSSSASHRKVKWIKVLESAKKNFDINEMSFEIYPYQLIIGELQHLAVSVGAESIVLQVSLLHDGVLVKMLEYIREFAPVPFIVSAIEIDRSSVKVRQESDKYSVDQITAELTIKWYLIDLNGAPDDIES